GRAGGIVPCRRAVACSCCVTRRQKVEALTSASTWSSLLLSPLRLVWSRRKHRINPPPCRNRTERARRKGFAQVFGIAATTNLPLEHARDLSLHAKSARDASRTHWNGAPSGPSACS